MKGSLSRTISFVSVLVLLTSQTWATCGGGGGGGMGGMGGGSMGTTTYPVPWKVIQAADPPLKDGLAVYWLPSSQKELEASSLRFSQTLSDYATHCVTMGIVDQRMALGQKIAPADKLPVAVLAQPDGAIIGKAENKNGYLKVDQVEKLLETEIKKREAAVKEKMDDAKTKVKAGDNQAAIAELREVYEQKCLFPKRAKDAAKELKKLGVTDLAEVPDGVNLDHAVMAHVEKTLRQGLKAENAANYLEAERLYQAAHQLDPSDPLSRAVALHGLGKMTIHEGDFKKGLELMEASVREYPLALTYRNLAVYWNSEGDKSKTDFYTQQALQLEPRDPYNLVFAAAFMAGNGHRDEALRIARENQKLLPASYNLAAIYAQAGQKEKALALLQRHFFEYERNQEVRSKEMMEARVDAVFASLINDSAFLALTKDADGRLPMRMSP